MKKLIFISIIGFLISSCSKEATIEIQFTPEFDGAPLALNEKYTNVSGYEITFTTVKFYTTNMNISENEIYLAHLYDMFEEDNNYVTTVEPQKLNEMSFNIGVSEAYNHEDPTQYETDHPLSTYSANGMHWTWNTGYIFFMIEGTYNAYPGNPDSVRNFLFHIGRDQYLNTFSASIDQDLPKNSNALINIGIDFKKLFYNDNDTIDLTQTSYTHSDAGEEWLTGQAAQNFYSCFYLKDVQVSKK